MLVHQKQILLVDDDLDTCEMMTLFLGLYGFNVKFAQTMAEGWRLARSQPFDLCVLDSHLPDGSGYELCQRICSTIPDLPVIFYSGAAYEKDRVQGLSAGARAYLVKPDDLDKLDGTLRAHLNKSEHTQVGINHDSRNATSRPLQTTTA